jgi:hypothetical protein
MIAEFGEQRKSAEVKALKPAAGNQVETVS